MPNKDKLYGRRWKRRAKLQLQQEPLCLMCRKLGQLTPVTVADHVEPHRGDVTKFWLGELQSLCKFHHDSTKQQQEKRGYSTEIGDDGWPTDPMHIANRAR